MSKRLTHKQRGFAQDYLKTGNGSLAVKKNYNVSTDESARAIASENLTKPNVREYLESKAERAVEIIYELAESAENEGVRLSASKDIADRAGYKPIEKTLHVNIEVEADDRVKEAADKLNELYGTRSISSDGIETSPMDTQTQD